MPVQERERTATTNIAGWRSTPSDQFVEELASLSHETRRIPDPYYFEITPTGELFSPTKHTKIKDEVKDKTSHLGQLEYQALLSIEQWAANNNEGAVVWVSPPQAEAYPVLKIIVSEIEYQGNVKKLFNRAILLDFDVEKCMKLAWNLTSFSHNKPVFTDLDQVRATPLIFDIKNGSWVNIFEKLIDDQALWTMVRNNGDRELKKETLRQAARVQKQFFQAPTLSYSIDAIMAVSQMLGPKPGSCPPKESTSSTAFGVFAGSSLLIGIGRGISGSDQYGSLEFECPKCKQTNRRPKGQLIPNCQHCKADVRC